MPWLAALVCCSAFDLALHDAFGMLVDLPVYETYGPRFMGQDLSRYLEPGSGVTFAGSYPCDYLVHPAPRRIPAWHLVAGKDPIVAADLTGSEPNDGYPLLLADWIRRDGLRCLKVKLRGDDPAWDYARLVVVGDIADDHDVPWLTPTSTARSPTPPSTRCSTRDGRATATYGDVEQPFPYDLERNRIDVRSVSARKPLFMDESAHDWRFVRLGAPWAGRAWP